MLRLTHGAIIMVLVAGLLVATPSTAVADQWGRTDCSDGEPRPGCDLNAGDDGEEGNSTNRPVGNDGDGTCRNPSGEVIPCQRGGSWAGSDGCYYSPADVTAETIAALGGQPEGEGGWYIRTCYSLIDGSEQALGGPVWVPGAPPVVSPEVLAREARARLELPDVVIALNPPDDQLVNLPIWLALDPSSWEEQSATASVPGVSVTATARPVKASWSMGDGGSVTCDGPGTAWTPGTDPVAASPDCGYTYRRSSAGAAGGRFMVTATVTWEVAWAGAGESGVFSGLATTGTVAVPVQESQTLVS